MSSVGTSAAGAAGGQLPEHMQIQRDNVICGSDLNYHVSHTWSTADACELAAAIEKLYFCRLRQSNRTTSTNY